ncbi:MAG: DUF1579 family protein [Alphaproteobacteria bacterium]
MENRTDPGARRRLMPSFLPLMLTFALGACSTVSQGRNTGMGGTDPGFAAVPESTFCSSARHRDLDFWLGTWTVRWTDPDTDQAMQGRNTIRPVLGGCGVLEAFDGSPGLPLRGMSLSTYHMGQREWRQLWIDNEGGYLPFTGGRQGDRFILTLERRNGNDPQRRMVWENIAPNSLTWRWQIRTEQDVSWRDLWVLAYERDGT